MKKPKRHSRKAINAQLIVRGFLERERSHLDRMTVNEHSADLLKIAAPEHYQVLRAYFDRRLRRIWD